MKKIVLLTVGLVAMSAQASQLSVRNNTLLSLGKMVAGVKLAVFGMFAVNVAGLEKQMVDKLAVIVGQSFDETYAEFISMYESGEKDLADRWVFYENFGRLLSILSTPPTIHESIELIRLSLSSLRILLTQQPPIEQADIARGLQIIAEMDKLVGVGKEMAYLDKAQLEQLDQLVDQVVDLFLKITSSIHERSSSITQPLERVVSESSYDLEDVLKISTTAQAYDAVVSLFYLYSTTGGITLEVKTRLEQELGSLLMDLIPTTTNINNEHLALSGRYLSGSISSHDFVDQYRQFLRRYTDYFSTEQIQKAEQGLTNLLGN